ncbi:MAG: glycosyltransferase [Synechococcus sp.]|nr:glycosyltransferase [Synechococcus sp.]
MRLLLVHQNFPAQFRDLAPAFASRGHEVVALGNQVAAMGVENVEYHRYISIGPPETHGLDPELESSLRRAEAAAMAAQRLQQQGLEPDIGIVHSAWGEALHLPAIWPRCRWIAYPEIHGSPACLGYGFHRPSDQLTANERHRIDRRNLLSTAALARCDAAVVPTDFQRSTFAAHWQPLLRVIHEGVNLEQIQPSPARPLTLPDGTILRPGEPLVTYASRSLEPLRGADIFLKALPALLRAHPSARVVIVGSQDAAYGSVLPGQEQAIPERLQHLLTSPLGARLHWVERLSHADLLALFRLSGAHAYLTYPYVLSWSLLEAMACGAPVVGSRSAPVEEVIEHGRNGLLVPFDQPDALAAGLLELLLRPEQARKLGSAARQTVEARFSLDQSIQAYEALFDELLDRCTTHRGGPAATPAAPANRQDGAGATA